VSGPLRRLRPPRFPASRARSSIRAGAASPLWRAWATRRPRARSARVRSGMRLEVLPFRVAQTWTVRRRSLTFHPRSPPVVLRTSLRRVRPVRALQPRNPAIHDPAGRVRLGAKGVSRHRAHRSRPWQLCRPLAPASTSCRP
jgi:hypothetical protein